MKKNANKGFSLVELIIVIAIMAVLVGIFSAMYVIYLEKSRESTDLQTMDAVRDVVNVQLADDNTKLPDGTYYFDKANNTLTTTKPSVPYGSGTSAIGDSDNKYYQYEPDQDVRSCVVAAEVLNNALNDMWWE